MPTPRQYQFDIDTKNYLNRVNFYRSLSGFPNIQNRDAADIDNFIIGLKDLGIWGSSICFLMRSQYNIGTGSTILSLGGEQNVTGNLVNSPSWGLDGITFNGTNYITAFLSKTIQTSEISIASVANSTTMAIQNGFPYQLSVSTNSYVVNGFSILSVGSAGNSWAIEGLQQSVRSDTSSIANQTFRLNGGRLFSGGTQNYLNGTTSTLTTSRNNQIFDRIQICGRWSNNAIQCNTTNFGVGWIGTQSFNMLSLDYINFSTLQTLIKNTIGKGLGLP